MCDLFFSAVCKLKVLIVKRKILNRSRTDEKLWKEKKNFWNIKEMCLSYRCSVFLLIHDTRFSFWPIVSSENNYIRTTIYEILPWLNVIIKKKKTGQIEDVLCVNMLCVITSYRSSSILFHSVKFNFIFHLLTLAVLLPSQRCWWLSDLWFDWITA